MKGKIIMKVYCCPSIVFSCPYFRDFYASKEGEQYIGTCSMQNPPIDCDSFATILEEELKNYVIEEF